MSHSPAPSGRAPWWIRLIGPLAAAVVLSVVDVGEIAAVLATLRWAPFLGALALVLPLFVVKGWRWRLLLRREGASLRLGEAIELYFLGAGVGSVTPGAIGDLSKGLSPSVGGRGVGLWTATIDRVYDVVLLVALGIAAAIALAEDARIGIGLVASLIVALGVAWRFQARLLAPFRRRIPGLEPTLEPHAPTTLAALGATIIGTFVAIVRFTLLIESLSFSLGWREVLVAFVLSSGVAALPLSIAGLGTRDLALVAWLGRAGIAPAEAVALSTLCLALQLWNAVVAALLWTVRPATSR